MSSSVQLLSGNTRTCSPFLIRPLYSDHGSGRCARGSHWPNSSRKLRMRSLARARSSSRRAPPNAASNPPASSASSRVRVCCRLRDAPGPGSATRPLSMDSCTEPTISLWPCSSSRRSRNSMTSSKLWPVSTCSTGNGSGDGPKSLLRQPKQHDRVLARREQQHRPLQLGDDLADDVHRLRLPAAAVRRRWMWSSRLSASYRQALSFCVACDTARPSRRTADRPGVPAPVSGASRGSRPSASSTVPTTSVRLRHSIGIRTRRWGRRPPRRTRSASPPPGRAAS